MNVTLRPMTLADVPQVHAIEVACFSNPWPEVSFREEVDNILARYLVAEVEGRMVGYGGIWMIIGEAQLVNIAVLPEMRGRRIGEKLIVALMHEANEAMGIEEMTLEVRVSNLSAQKLYERMGFVTEGIRPKYYEDNKEDAYIMWNHDIKPWLQDA